MTIMHHTGSSGPKRFSIDKLIVRPHDIKKVLTGTKTMVRRNGRYADVGETFILENKMFIITSVFSQTLGELTNQDVQKDGYNTLEDYKRAVVSSHAGMEWNPEMKVWAHEFRLFEE